MAAITSAVVTLVDSYPVLIRGRQKATRRCLDVVLSAQGGTALDIPASALGFTRLLDVDGVNLIVSGPAYRCATVGLDSSGLEVITYDLTNATDASRTTRANLTGTLRIWVTGIV